MNCADVERLLTEERDAPVPASAAADLSAHLHGCASCRRLQEDLTAGFLHWKGETAARSVPDAHEAWRDLRTTLHARAERTGSRPWIRWASFGLPLAAAAAVSMLLVRPPALVPPAAGSLARVEYVEPGSPGASTLVYEDPESGWLVIWAADAETAKGL